MAIRRFEKKHFVFVVFYMQFPYEIHMNVSYEIRTNEAH